MVGNGHASKLDIYRFVLKTYPAFEFGKLWSYNKDNPTKGPPHPLEDLCDAIGVVMSSFLPKTDPMFINIKGPNKFSPNTYNISGFPDMQQRDVANAQKSIA